MVGLSLTRMLARIALLLAVGMSLMVAPGSMASAGDRFALVIGNSAYQSISALPNPERDAKLLGETLTALNFKTTVVQNLDLTAFKKAIAAFSDAVTDAGPDSIALVYYAGHGVQIDGVNYLVPVDASAKSASGVVLSSVSASDLLRALDDAAAATNIVIFDACRDNPFKTSSRGFNRGLAQITAPSGTIIAYATAPGQTASDGRGENSPYAAALARNLGTPGLSLETVFKRVRVDVNVETNGTQTPWEETSLTRDIELVAGPSQPEASTTPAQPSAASEMDIKRAYLKAVNLNTVEAYDAFISAFPHSELAVQALKNIEALTDEQNWREAVSKDTVGGYVLYVSLHRDGNYVDQANAKIAAMRQVPRQVETAPQAQTVFQAPPAAATEFVNRPGFDIYGGDYRVIKDVDFDGCLSACRAEGTTCKALSFSRSAKRCFLKSSGGLLLRNANADSAVSVAIAGALAESRIEVLTRTDVQGSDYTDFQATDFRGCLVQCETDQRCAAFSFVRKDKWCWLKSSAGAQKANRLTDSGIKH